MSAQTVVEELSRDELTREHVEQRVEDWARRIDALYDDVERWLPAQWSAKHGDPVTMHEEPMKKVGVPPRELPTLELARDNAVRIRLRPYGLWIIGANGRVDLVKGSELYFVVDHSKTFEAPSWHISAAIARREPKPFDAGSLARLTV